MDKKNHPITEQHSISTLLSFPKIQSWTAINLTLSFNSFTTDIPIKINVDLTADWAK